jgi:hypothetical protein
MPRMYLILFQEAASPSPSPIEPAYGMYVLIIILIVLIVIGVIVAVVLIIRTLMKSESNKPHVAPPEPRAPAIFITYRRDDSIDVTGRIYDRLCEYFGKENVFKDVDSIPLGVNFRKYLGEAVGKCDVLLTIIGRRWLAADSGQRRLDDDRDFVRIEIEAALKREIPVVPVLVQGSSMPRTEDLPQTLQPLVEQQGIPVRPDPDFHPDMSRLIKGIEGYLKYKTKG